MVKNDGEKHEKRVVYLLKGAIEEHYCTFDNETSGIQLAVLSSSAIMRPSTLSSTVLLKRLWGCHMHVQLIQFTVLSLSFA